MDLYYLVGVSDPFPKKYCKCSLGFFLELLVQNKTLGILTVQSRFQQGKSYDKTTGGRNDPQSQNSP